MSFIKRMTRCPDPYNAVHGREVLALFDHLPSELCDLLAGTAGCSPYLKLLIEKEAKWLASAFDTPETAAQTIFDDLKDTRLTDLPAALRQAKRRIALLTALADLAGVWPLEQVTGTLTQLADLSVDVAIKALVGAEITRGKVPGQGEDAIPTAGGMVALAMGKMGAAELNYSSDIDLICLFDETRFNPGDDHEARAAFVRATRKMAAMLSDITADGYVFRTDLRLRPDASVTPVCLSMAAAERYYESVGRTWERAAYIKARACAGDIASGDRFLQTLTPFVWRKHLDFAAIQDAHDMRLKIRSHKGLHGPITLEGHNMKLGRGGIREIEFFTQTRQLIAGGRDPSLRLRGTIDGLDALVDRNWVPDHVADVLKTHYRTHREVEHRLQMIGDAQTHDLPKNVEGFDRLAAFMGTSTETLRRDLNDSLTQVHELTESFFAPSDRPNDDDDTFGDQITARWPNYPALRSTRAVEIFKRLRPELLRKLKRAAKPEEALVQFDGFLAGLPAGVQLFSLFQASPQLVDLIVDICASAPALAQYLSRNSAVLDAVIGGDFFAPWPGGTDLTHNLETTLLQLQDYEAQLDTARLWAKEWHFRVGVHHLRGLISAADAGAQYADIAQAVVAALWPCVVAQFATKHGDPPGRGAAVVAMGSLGAGRLHAASDLDLIVIYDDQGIDASDGRRPLPTRSYFARLTQALVTALSAPMAQGKLYEVDMRLRPSGRQGPVATSLTSFQKYQLTEAWTWEHLAQTRARVIAGRHDLIADIEAFREDLLQNAGAPQKTCDDVIDMRRRLIAAKPAKTEWDIKLGHGGMQDIELLAQASALIAGEPSHDVVAQLQAGAHIGWYSDQDMQKLTEGYEQFWAIRATGQLLGDDSFAPDTLGQGACDILLRETGQNSLDDILKTLSSLRDKVAAIADRVLANPPLDVN
ncbi:glutamine-synthetase adenylyltransferase [Parasulfitobacter algicola]|uniref:Glutamine-synthetase adenylyltransferase n=1 Tax=Parasulfitobacter algicola TaxID=2614809 RepID=A0ABX2IYH7_9RHOB|nr:glutamine-synthetase adenylyltransferase [Sulfitobacter algicola]NSX55298.1 glutamine-synthetase adenylyltransferase [Sulfitobacter algicola]